MTTARRLVSPLRSTLIALVAFGSSAGVALDSGTMDKPLASIRADLDRALPRGTSADRVGAHLDAAKVEHSAYLSEDRTIRAIWRGLSSAPPVTGSVQAIFRFDEGRNLLAVELKPVFTGP